MLEKVNLDLQMPKDEFKKIIPEIEIRISTLQRSLRELGIPMIVVFEGWDAAGKGTLINSLMLSMDPRGYKVYSVNPPNEEERFRPWLWRFWTKTPENGRVVIFDKSWYERVLRERVNKTITKKVVEQSFEEVNSFERQLTDNGTIIIKFFLHITKQEQKKRFENIEKNKATSWKITDADWEDHKNYRKYLDATEDMLVRTDSSWAPWTILEAHDRRYATSKMFTTILDTIERSIDNKKSAGSPVVHKQKKTPANSSTSLQKVSMNRSLTREEYSTELRVLQDKLFNLEHSIYLKRIPVVIVYEGWDAAGKGGNIKRLVSAMDPRGYEVIPVGAPTDTEKLHHYLWRFWNSIPKGGHLTIFDRSWYGRVLVERVENFCSEYEWRKAYQEINEMESQWSNFGMIIIKFWLHIDKDEQLQRFKTRESIPYKKWKITEDDWRNREKWDLYEDAVNEMLLRTSTNIAPWTVIEANDKLYARIKTLKTVITTIEQAL